MKDIAKYLYEMGQLKRVVRSGWWIAGIESPESVAEHSFRVAILGYILARLEGSDPLTTVVMCLFHDVHEARLNDLHRVGKRYASDWRLAEEQAISEQMNRLPPHIAGELAPLLFNFENAKSLESRIARDADLLECLIQAREYQAQGYYDVQTWIDNCHAELITESAKKIADECMQVEPREWWRDLMPMTEGVNE